MNQLSIIGAVIVTLALISYAIAIISEQRSSIISKKVLFFLTFGVILDITATLFMILGSTNSPFTFHGFIGYSALAAMLIDCILIWRAVNHKGLNSSTPRKLHIYSRYAFVWWIIAYITGSLLVAI